MATKLSQLRVTADLDAASYVKAAADIVNADQALIQSVRQVGQEFAAIDVASGKVEAATKKISRSFTDGYRDAEKFNIAMRDQIGRAHV